MATPADEMRGLCTAVGFVVLIWGMIERQLDNWVMVIFHDCNGDTIRKDIPRSLKPKIAFLRKAFRTLQVLEPFKDDALDMLQQVSQLSEKRHDFVHGSIEKVTPKTFEFSRIEYSERHHHVKYKKFSAKNYPALSRSLLDLVSNTGRLSQRLLKTIPRRIQ